MFFSVFFLQFVLGNCLEIDLRLYKDSHSFKTKSNYYIDNYFLYLIPVCLGTPPQCFHIFYDVNFTHLLINPNMKKKTHYFDASQSSTVTQSSIEINFNTIKSTVFSDFLYLDLMKFEFAWLYGTEVLQMEAIYEGKMGFGRNYNNNTEKYHEKYSIVHKLYNSGKIKKKIFGHKYFHNRKYLRLYLGEINLNEFNNNKQYPKCFVEASSKKLAEIDEIFDHLWSCELKRLHIYNEDEEKNPKSNPIFEFSFPNNNSVLFSTVSNLITGPIDQGTVLIEFILSLPAAKNDCSKYSFHKKHISIRCKFNVDVFQFPKIYFELNGVTLILPPENLFHKEYAMDREKYVYKARFVFSPDYYFWTIGQAVLREYDMIFDMDEGSVGFWNSERISSGQNSDFLIKVIGKISCVIVFAIVIYLIILCICKWWKKKENKIKKDKLLSNITKLNDFKSLK